MTAKRQLDDDEMSTMEIVAAISHELRSPLTSVKGFSRLLLDRWDRLSESDKLDLVAQIHRDADRVSRLVTELLDISRIESGRLRLRYELIDLDQLLHDIVSRVALAFPALVCPVTLADAAAVWGDRDRLEQVLTNLLENGAKYATVDHLRIDVNAEEPDVVAIAVSDEGPGIPEDELERIFSKFARRDVAQPSGTGLGLWISRNLAVAHHGSLRASRNHRGGTTFTLRLPFDARPEDER
jgi:signal transduction histidine kinase